MMKAWTRAGFWEGVWAVWDMSAAEAFMYWGEVEATLCKRGSDVKWLTTIALEAGRS